ncbi:MAG: oligosaccharide flippase family protein, partial [Candidatus Omnitrophica bacterium]|nr:oligosaccharide flippase family protein [Candidatus Omnitrophota bacterium]
MDISQKVIRNTFYYIAGRSWGFIISIFLTPYIIGRIGLERYGVWAIIGLITGYFGLLDFGIGLSFTKYVAEFFAKKEFKKISSVINLGVAFYSLFAILVISLTYFLADPLLVLFKIPPELYSEARFVFWVGIILFLASNITSPFYAVQSGLQRMDIINKIAIAVSIPQALGTVYFLRQGYGLPGLMINNIIIFVLASVVHIVFAFRILPELRFNPFVFDLAMFRKLFIFGFKIQIAKIAIVISTQTDKLFISYFLTLAAVSFYQLGNSIIYYAMTLTYLLVTALVPAFSEIEAKGDRMALVEAYFKSTRYLSFIAIPLFIFVLFFSHRIIFVWLGSGYEKAVLVSQILALAWMLNAIAQVAASVCIAIDAPQLFSRGALITIVTNIFLSYILIKTMGFYGVAIGTLVAVNCGAAYSIMMLHKELKISLKKFYACTLPFLWASLLCALMILFIDRGFVIFIPHLKRIPAFILLFIEVNLFLAAYLYLGRR